MSTVISSLASLIAYLEATVCETLAGRQAEDAFVGHALAVRADVKSGVKVARLVEAFAVSGKAYVGEVPASLLVSSPTAIAYLVASGNVFALPGAEDVKIAPRRVQTEIKIAVKASKLPAVRAAITKATTQAEAIDAIRALQVVAPVDPTTGERDATDATDDATDDDPSVTEMIARLRDAIMGGADVTDEDRAGIVTLAEYVTATVNA